MIYFPIPTHISFYLGLPERTICGRNSRANRMSVPEISVHEYSQSAFWKYEVWASGKAASPTPSLDSGDLHQLDKAQFSGSIP
jgi:hypothetical protein